MKLIKHEVKEHLRREEAAQRLRDVADELARHNELPFVRDGVRYTVAVPDDLVYELEIEVKDKKSEIEIKLKW
jgi:amphi-Trp domain-containing protein